MKKNKYIHLIFQVTLFVILISCKTNYRSKAYEFNRELKFEKVNGVAHVFPQTNCKKSIVIVSDSTLNYSVTYGDIGKSTTIKYKRLNDILKIDTVDIYNRKSFQKCTNEIFGYEYIYSNDSLIGKNNGEKYYVINTNEKKEPFFIVYRDKVYKIRNQKNFYQLFRKIKQYNPEGFIILDKDIAKKKYGINNIQH